MKNDAKKRFWRRMVYAALFLLFLLFLYAPRPLSIEEGFQVHSILYRAPDWQVLHYYYPIQGVEQQLDQQALKEILEKVWVLPHFLLFELPQTFPQGGVTYFIWWSDSSESQTLHLGEINLLETNALGNYQRYYTILNAEEIMAELDALLRPSEKKNLVPLA